MLEKIVKGVPVVGQAYGFVNVAMKVYDTTSPLQALKTGVLGVLTDCAPPQVKYPVKCGLLLAQVGLAVSTGGSSTWTIAMVIALARQIIDD